MRVGFFTRGLNERRFYGDKQVLLMLINGLKELGHKAFISDNPEQILSCDHIFLSNIIYNLSSHYNLLKLFDRPYNLVSFHEDVIKYFGPATAFYNAIAQSLKGDHPYFNLEHLMHAPDHILFFSTFPRNEPLLNYEVIKNAKLCMANTPTEKETILRDCPSAKVACVPLGPGFLTEERYDESDAFLTLSGLKSKDYILQIGRFSTRKNQLGSILATKDLDVPLVFIANYPGCKGYTKTCYKAATKWRKAPTLIFSSTIEPYEEGPLKVIRVPTEWALSHDLVLSAYQHAGLYLHPAFMELPGFVSLEAAKLGIPSVASSWTTLKDYFTDPKTGEYTLDERIAYVDKPYDINAITSSVEAMFGKSFPQGEHPTFSRREKAMAEDLLQALQGSP